MSGATVTVTGIGAPLTMSSDSRGEFRVLNLSPGRYSVSLAAEGFAGVTLEDVIVRLGNDTELAVTMKVSAVLEAVTVSGEIPVLERRTVTTGANIPQEELNSIPTARDPWSVLRSVPGIQIDRVNVGGSENTLQASFSSKGSSLGTFAIDGISTTDTSVAGASTMFYDFDSFQEMQVVTGGDDPSLQGSGAHLNMITKRGTNEIHGSGRFYIADHRFGWENLPREANDQQLTSGNRVESVQDYGLEAGGPIARDRAWLWGAYGRYQTELRTLGIGNFFPRSTLENFNGKLNAQLVASNSAEVWYQRSDLLRFGRNAGPTHPQETTWDQKLPQNTWKIEDSQVFSSNLFGSVRYSGQNGTFTLIPAGGLQTQIFLDADGVWHNTYLFYDAPRSQRQVRADGSQYFSTGKLGHELKAGFSYIAAINSSTTVWPGDGSGGLAAKTIGDQYDCDVPCALLLRDSAASSDSHLYAVFLSDTISLDRLTANLGLRWDRQYGRNRPTSVSENASFPRLLPAVRYPGHEKEFTWTDLQPRVGLTYAFGASRKTIAKASYAKFAEALGIATMASTNPLVSPSYVYYSWNDRNGDHLVQPGEVDTSPAGYQFSRNYDPGNPGSLSPLNGLDPKLKAPTADEFVVGLDHELMSALAVGISYTYRRYKNQLYDAPYAARSGIILNRGDYEQYTTLTGTLSDGSAYSEPVYQIRQSVLDRLGGLPPPGSFTFNRSDFSTTYHGFELTLTKLLTKGWMARGSFVWNDNRQHVGPNGCADPTNVLNTGLSSQTTNGQSCRDGDLVAVQAGGAGNKGGVFLNSKWQANLMALYQLPLGFSAAGSFFARQGYPINWFVRTFGETDGLPRNVAVTPAGRERYGDVHELDLRIEKLMNISRGASLVLSADLFNAANANTVLQRQNRLELDSTNSIREVQSPRIWRFGARVAF